MISWTTPNNDQVQNWSDFQTQLLASIARFRELPRPSCFKRTKSGFNGSGYIAGGLMLPDGRVFFAPYQNGIGRIYDPIMNDVYQAGGASFGSASYHGAVLMKDGRVFVIPRDSTTARIWNPATDHISTPSGTYRGSDAYYGGVLLPSGKVFMVPGRNNPNAAIYDPDTDSMSLVGGFPASSGDAFYGGVLLPNGEVFCVPRNTTDAYIYNEATNTVRTVSGFASGSDTFYGGVLMASGKVYLIPGNASAAQIYDYTDDSVTTANGTFSGGTWLGGCLMPDGRVWVNSRTASKSKIYDELGDTLIDAPSSYGTNDHGAVCLTDGRVMTVTGTSTASIVSSGYGVPLDPQITTSPFFNKL